MSFNDQMDQVYLRQERTVRRIGRAVGVGGDWSPAANFNIFQITGGPIRITGMFGHVTALFAGNATPLIEHTPTGGGNSPLCVIAGAAAYALNTLLVWDGSLTGVSGVLRASTGVGHSQPSDSVGTPATAETWAGGGIEIIPGIIRITNGGAADATGGVDWYLTYKPLTSESQVVVIP